MKIRLICAECKRLLKVPEEALGKKILCPACGARFIGERSLVRVKRQPQPAAAGPASAPARTRPDQAPAAPAVPPIATPPPAMPPAAAPSPPPLERPAAFDFPRLELDPSHAARRTAPEDPEVVESLDDLLAEPAPDEPMVVEDVAQEVEVLEPEVVDSEVVDLTESQPEVLMPDTVSELDDDVIVPEVVEPEPAQAVEAFEPEIVDLEAAEPEVVEAAEPEVVEAAEPEVVEAIDPEVIESATLEPEIVEPEMPVFEEATEPDVVEALEEEPVPSSGRPVLAAAEDEEDEPVGKRTGAKKKSNKGLLIGCLVGGLFLLLLGCGGGVVALIYIGNQANNATTAVTRMGPNMGTTRTGGQQIPPPIPGQPGKPQEGQSGTNAANEWKPFSPKGGNFTVQLPGDPKTNGNMFMMARPMGSFTIYYVDVPKGDKNPTQALENQTKQQRDLLSQAFKSQPISQREFNQNGVDGREFIIEGPQKVMVIVRLFLSKQGDHYRIYQLAATGLNYRADSGEAGKFFDSFQVQPEQAK